MKKRGRTSADRSAPSKLEVPGFWELRLLPFLERYSFVIALCLVAIASLRIVSTYSALSLTVDEPAHFADGLEYVATHVYRYRSEHPPLARVMIALGPYLDGSRPRRVAEWSQEGLDVMLHSGHPDRTLALMRVGILPFFWLASAVVYFWTRRHFGKALAAVALGLFTLEPAVLAHAGLATTDMALTACLGAAFFSMVLWAESPTWKHTLLMGLTAAMAALSKFTALGFLPAAAVLALLFRNGLNRPRWKQLASLASTRAPMIGIASLSGALAIWACYSFSFGQVPAWNLKLPAPEFWQGIWFATRHTSVGHSAFLLGQYSNQGWWYYFPVALAVKSAIASILLLVPGAWICWRDRAKAGYLLPLAFSLGVLLPSMAGHVNIGVRHVLPVYAGIAIMAAVGLDRLARWARTPAITLAAVGVPLVWMAASGAVQHPGYLAYFNAFAGAEPYRLLLDSNLDWGQDLKRLGKRLREIGVKKVAYVGSFDSPEWMPLRALYGLPPIVPVDGRAPTEVWTVVSPNYYDRPKQQSSTLAGIDFDSLSKAMRRDQSPWYTRQDPAEKIGTLFLYKSSAGAAP